MRFFSAAYPILADDITALGPHQYLTTTRFQSAIWEGLLADAVLGEKPGARDEFEAVALLFTEGYNRVLAPVNAGERVAVLVSFESLDESTLRLCFRVVLRSGEPAACGFQTVTCISRHNGRPVPFPRSLAEFLRESATMREPANPPFAERAFAGGKAVNDLFPDDVRTLGARVAFQPDTRRSETTGKSIARASAAARASGVLRTTGVFATKESPRRSSAFTVAPPEYVDLVAPDGGTAFLFPGQGSYDGRTLRELYDLMPHFDAYFAQADEVARRHFGQSFFPLVRGESLARHDEQLRLCPDLDQLGIFLTGVLLAEALEEKSVRADVLIGHSFGELAALAAAGAFDVATGLEIVAQRVLALRTLPTDAGAMVALSCAPERVRTLLESLGLTSVTVSVINHGKQTVVSASRADLSRVQAAAPGLGISATLLKSRYPFHSPLLQGAAERFGAALRDLPFRTPRRQVYSPIEGALYSARTDFPHVLSSHFVRPLDFREAVATVRGAGFASFVECGAGGVLAGLVRKNLPDASPDVATSPASEGRSLAGGLLSVAAARAARKAPPAASRRSTTVATPVAVAAPLAPEPAMVDDSAGYPVAIVAMGCVLPGAHSPQQYWRNLLEGVSGITTPAPDSPDYFDFVGGDDVTPDKSYTMLHGDAGKFERDPRVPYTPEEYERLTRAQQLLANALAQCVSGLRGGTDAIRPNTRCLLGSTADGVKEYEEALLVESLQRAVAGFDEPEALRAAFASGLTQLADIHSGDPDPLAPFAGFQSVVHRTLGQGIDTVLLDAACASSLYAVDFATRLLWNFDSDLVIAGGAFSPGPANGPLFAQFGGLATADSFPFDERADGVIFGEAGAVLALKRLPDAIRDGDHIYGVVRAVGLSSDGKSPSVNVPRASGQALAVRRAYDACGIDRRTIQFVEAHATATPVGDATEFEALRGEFSDRDPQSPLFLESVKCLLGHTGWVAGASSIIKLCLSFAERTIPPQHNYAVPNPGIQIAGSPFTIPTSALPWPSNVDGLPRRAGISGFGFGGTNAHVVLEAFEPSYHARLARRVSRPSVRTQLAVVAASGLFPTAGSDALNALPSAAPGPLPRSALRLPAKKRLLPDALEHMDASQFLAVMSAEQLLHGIPNWTEHRERIALAFGLTGKVGRGIMSIERIYADRLRRLLPERRKGFALDDVSFQRLSSKLLDAINRDNPPSNAYTLVGMMPNVATGRVANMFDLNGPNLVVDSAGTSALESLRLAELWLAGGDADLVLAGGVNTSRFVHPARRLTVVHEENACALALTTPEIARANAWSVIALLSVGGVGNDTVAVQSPDAPTATAAVETPIAASAIHVAGLSEIARAVHAAQRGAATSLRWGSARVEQRAEPRVTVEARVGIETGTTASARPAVKVPLPIEPMPCPVAIVGMGCVIPGASDIDQFWRNMMEGVSGVVQMEKIIPDAMDFISAEGEGVVADKTYSFLWGYAGDIRFDPRVPYTKEEFSGLARGQQLLANALAQSLGGVRPVAKAGRRIRCVLGASAEGVREYDEALFVKRLQYIASTFDEPADLRAAFADGIGKLPEYCTSDPEQLAMYVCAQSVLERFLGTVDLTLSDVACASSLYALDLGVKELRNGETDVAIAGGVFSPGPLLAPLFAQFKGLASKGCFPFDARADGVIFGEGAAVLVLKRLSDAIENGDHIYGVVRGVGNSSDGKAPSANVPRPGGQSLAMQRAYGDAKIDVRSIQLVEAHATSTPVGDACEFEALQMAYRDRDRSLPPVYLESVKSIIGHTGWLAGAASIIKVCTAFEKTVIPPQFNFAVQNPNIELAGSPFVIPTTAVPWPENIDGLPRRAGVSGFGFGGSNAHAVLEAFDADYHGRLVQHVRPEPKRATLAVVGVGGLFAADGGSTMTSLPQGSPAPVRREVLRLPPKTRLLPDAVEHMDVSQFLTVMGAEKALQAVEEWALVRERIGVALGLTGKTPRAVAAIERVFLDHLKRVVGVHRDVFRLTDADYARLAGKLYDVIATSSPPSNAYTMLGMLPNLAAGRVANLFDLNGPNMVIDAGTRTVVEVVRTAERWLACDNADIVLAGGLHTDTQRHQWRESAGQSNGATQPSHEGALVLALTTPERARERGWPIAALMTVGAPGDDHIAVQSARDGAALNAPPALEASIRSNVYEVAGLAELARSIDAAQRGGTANLRWQPVQTRQARNEAVAASSIPAEPARVEEVGFYSPAIFPAPELAAQASATLPRILFLVTGAAAWGRLIAADDFDASDHGVVCPSVLPVPGAMTVDLTSDDTVRASLSKIDFSRFDAVVAVRDLSGALGESFLAELPERDLLSDLLFLVGREVYERVHSRALALASLNLGAWSGSRLHPETGLYAGFIKSVERELRGSVIKCVNTDATRLSTAVRQLAGELQQPAPAEVFYRHGRRHVHKLVPLAHVTRDQVPYLGPDSVVIATGGGRGVTAVMAEELLTRFGCSIVMFGRSDLSRFPRRVLEMDNATFAAYEPQFYREEVVRRPGIKMVEHKRSFERLQAAHEIFDTVRRLSALPGRVEYVSVDITDAAAVDHEVSRLLAERGRIDLVMHGAGVQTSLQLPKRKLVDWRRTLETKLSGLRNLYGACRRYAPGPVNFHILTSAFSYIGNDGQPDYGAANDAMNRLADYMGDAGAAHWTTIAWLAWNGIGMTRGSEYATLAKERDAYPLDVPVGRECLARLMAGRATAPSNILLTKKEERYYGDIAIATLADEAAAATARAEVVRERRGSRQWLLTVQNAPYLLEHVVSGTPTLPGTFEIELAAQAARELRSDRSLIGVENATFRRFLRVPADRQVYLRGEATVVSENDDETLIHVRLLSDFVHKSGRVLEKDIVHFEVDARLATAIVPLRGPCERWERFDGRPAFDPYVAAGSPVQLGGLFSCLDDIVIGPELRRARFRLPKTDYTGAMQGFMTPPVLLDAMLRFGSLSPQGSTDPSMVFVPEQGAKIHIRPGMNDVSNDATQEDIYLVAANPTMEGDLVINRWVQAMDSHGRTLIVAEGGVGRRMEGVRVRA